ncbi:Hsp20/alpha crystallin family protein [Asanoa sp. NPDC049518]|uniref:Hsp20/alpha crystallin family protein n=1 Tax=unclassified Asanoa TaxID=2685164 RepID=UPI00342AD16D
MLMRTDPFRDLDSLAQRVFGTAQPGTWSRPAAMPMDAYRSGDDYVILLDLPGVAPDAIDIRVERNVLTVKAERRPLHLGDDAQLQVSERALGVFSRQLFLGDALDADRIEAGYDNGVLVVKIPIVEEAKPRKVAVAVAGDRKEINA